MKVQLMRTVITDRCWPHRLTSKPEPPITQITRFFQKTVFGAAIFEKLSLQFGFEERRHISRSRLKQRLRFKLAVFRVHGVRVFAIFMAKSRAEVVEKPETLLGAKTPRKTAFDVVVDSFVDLTRLNWRIFTQIDAIEMGWTE